MKPPYPYWACGSMVLKRIGAAARRQRGETRLYARGTPGLGVCTPVLGKQRDRLSLGGWAGGRGASGVRGGGAARKQNQTRGAPKKKSE